MSKNSMTVREINTFPPLSCSDSERPPVIMTNAALEALQDEREAARRAWMRALLAIPAKLGARRTAAVMKALKLREHYEQLIGHLAGKPDEPVKA